MKKFFLTSVILFSMSIILFGQNKFISGNMRIESNMYEVRVSDMSPIIGISNLSKNVKNIPQPVYKSEYDPLPIRERDVRVDTTLARTLIIEILKNKLPALKVNKDFITVSYIFYPDGRIMNIDYILPLRTIITPKELDKIDQSLRKKIKVHLTGNEYKAFPAIHYNAQKRIYF